MALAVFFIFSIAVHGYRVEAKPAALIANPVQSLFVNEVGVFRPVADHHFELTAPQQCGTLSPIKKTAREISCQFHTAGQQTLHFSVCANNKSSCQSVMLNLMITPKAAAAPGVVAQEPSIALKSAHVALEGQLLKGFRTGLPPDIREEAQRENKPVFLLISTDWCPPCNEAKENLFSTEAFQKISKDWLKVYVDGDSRESAEWGKVVPFHEFPTIVFLDSRLNEEGRFHSATRWKEFSQWAKQVSQRSLAPISDIRPKVLARQKGGWLQRLRDLIHGQTATDLSRQKERLIGWALAAEDQKVLSAFTEKDIPSDLKMDWYSYKYNNSQDGDKTDQIGFLKKALVAAKGREEYIDFLDELCDLDKHECQVYSKDMDLASEKIREDKDLTEAEKAAALADQFYGQSLVYKTLGRHREAHAKVLDCVTQSDRFKSLSPLKMPRAANQVRAYCLAKAGRAKAAERLYKSLIKAYPSEPTFLLSYAYFLKSHARLKKAHNYVSRAMKVSYAYNWFKAVFLKARIEMQMKHYKDALQTVHGALAEVHLSADPKSRDQHVAGALRGLESKIQARL